MKLSAILSIGFVALGSGCASMSPQMISSIANSAAQAYDSRNKLKAALGEQKTTQDIYKNAYSPKPKATYPNLYGSQYALPYRPMPLLK